MLAFIMPTPMSYDIGLTITTARRTCGNPATGYSALDRKNTGWITKFRALLDTACVEPSSDPGWVAMRRKP